MRLGAVTRIGLKSPNSLSHDIPSVLRRTVNVSERVQGVSISEECGSCLAWPECSALKFRLKGVGAGVS